MKFIASLFVIIVAFVTFTPAVCLAQGWLCGPGCLSMFSVQPKVFVGYMFPNSPTTLSVDVYDNKDVQIQNLKQSYNVQGLWTELVVPIQCPTPIGFTIGFGYLFPVKYRSQETYNTIEEIAERTWSTSTQMVNFQVAATYRFSPLIIGILGFRYDSFMTNFMEPGAEVLPNSLSFQRHHLAQLTFSGDLPFVGVSLERNLAYGSIVKAGVIGFPPIPGAVISIPGQIEYDEAVGNKVSGSDAVGVTLHGEFSSGYFLEGFAELSSPISNWVEVGAFAKYNGVYARATEVSIGHGLFDQNIIENANANITFFRSSWMFGGAISASF